MTSSIPAPNSDLRDRFASGGGKPAYVRAMFDRIARVYDVMNHLMTGGLDTRWRAFAARQAALVAGERALDVGCGTGDMSIALARRSPIDVQITGADFSEGMLAVAREKVRKLGLGERIKLVLGDGQQLPFADGAFDAVTSAWVVRNLSDIPGSFREMRRVTRPGGRVVCLEMSHPYNPIFNWGFHLYFDRIVPLLGGLIGKSFDAYSYLPSSVISHPNAPQLKRVMEEAGLSEVRYYYLMGGVVAVHIGLNPR
jgi:demethylmenaquinone methyltransferase/2-methoxy-6-polyprenyl-1,4-benzoquinol methylase